MTTSPASTANGATGKDPAKPPSPGELAADIEATVRASFERQGMMTTLAARIVELSPGRLVVEMPFAAGISQQHGYFHGGAVGALADSAAGYAALTLMSPGSEVVSIEYKINFVRPAAGNLLRATGHVVRAGRTMTVVTSDVHVVNVADPNATPTLCAILQATMMRVEGDGR